MTLEQIREEAMALPELDRVLLGEQLLIGPQSDDELAGIEKAWIVEAERRMADLRAGRTKAIPYETVMAELKQKLSR